MAGIGGSAGTGARRRGGGGGSAGGGGCTTEGVGSGTVAGSGTAPGSGRVAGRRVAAGRTLLLAALVVLLVVPTAAGCDDTPATTGTTTASTTAGTAAPADTTTSAPAGATTTSSEPPATTTSAGPAPTTPPGPHTPAMGTAERAAIMDAQRAFMAAQGMPSDVVFVVDWLRVDGGWAYSKVNPQSPDGGAQYEPLAFLLRDRGGWAVVDIFGSEGDMSVEDTAERYMMTRHPDAPDTLFP